jgi:outer membrane usher protein
MRGSGVAVLGLVLAAAAWADDAPMGEFAPFQADATEVLSTNPEILPYTVVVNGRAVGDAVLLKLPEGPLLARAGDWDRWRLKKPTDKAYQFENEIYFALDQAPGFKAALDAQQQQARLEFAPRAFASSVLTASRYRRVAPTPPPGLGGFLNYEFVGTQRVPEGAEALSNLNSLVEVGGFNRLGVATSQWLGTNITEEEQPALGLAAERRVIRLETALVRDLPDDMETIRLGDGTGASGLWGRPVRFGGVRWTRNFATQPGFVTLPQPALSGETALPSVLDVYVDGLRRESLEVPPGEFLIENLPVLTGQGEVQVVVRDLLGRETLISDSYFTQARMLRAGLSDFSYEAGFPREQFGRESDEYGKAFGAFTQRYGFNDQLTGEARAEVADGLQVAGVGAVFSVEPLGVMSNAFAISNGDAGTGALDVLTFQRTMRRGLTLGARVQVASPEFRQVGLAADLAPPLRSVGANLGLPIPRVGRFGLGYVEQHRAAPQGDLAAVTGTFSTSFRPATLTLVAVNRIEPGDDWSVGLTLSVPLSPRDHAAAGVRRGENDAGLTTGQSYARLQRNVPLDEGWGYRAIVAENTTDGARITSGEAGVGLNAAHGSYALEASLYDELSTYRATVSGGLGTLGGHVFASRKITSSFAIVETGAEGIDVLVENRVAAHTDEDGVAVLPYLQAYQANAVRIDASQVPMDLELAAGELKAAPYYRSGMLIPLDAKRTRSAVLVLKQSDGTLVPAGASARLGGLGDEFPVGKGGKVFLSRLAPNDNAVEVRWNHHRCLVTFDLPAGEMQPQLGPLECRNAPP